MAFSGSTLTACLKFRTLPRTMATDSCKITTMFSVWLLRRFFQSHALRSGWRSSRSSDRSKPWRADGFGGCGICRDSISSPYICLRYHFLGGAQLGSLGLVRDYGCSSSERQWRRNGDRNNTCSRPNVRGRESVLQGESKLELKEGSSYTVNPRKKARGKSEMIGTGNPISEAVEKILDRL